MDKLPNILVTGTPGVGKTSLAMLLADALNEQIKTDKQFNYLNLGKMIKDKKLYDTWNEEYDVPEFDEDKILDELEPMLNEGGYVVDFHSVYFIPDELANLVVLLRCDNTVLYDRLLARGYSEKKIKENIECEIMEVTSDDVRENFQESKILELSNEHNDQMMTNIDEIIKFLKAIYH
jgi:broad-specificity NMP kinase